MINPEFDKLLSAVIPIAQTMLKDLGAFIPFGAFITSDGEVQLAGGAGDPSRFETGEIVEMYVEAYREAILGFKATTTHQIVAEYDMGGDFSRGDQMLGEIRTRVKPDNHWRERSSDAGANARSRDGTQAGGDLQHGRGWLQSPHGR